MFLPRGEESPAYRPPAEEVSKAVRINEAARLRSLKIAFLALGSVSLLAIFPARRLPAYKPGEVPSEKGQTF